MNYITFREPIEDGLGYFILQKEFPHYLCNISESPVVNFIQPMPVTSYNLWLCFKGTIRGNFIPSYKDVYEEIRSVMQDMANWYFENRILIEPKKYRKWKV